MAITKRLARDLSWSAPDDAEFADPMGMGHFRAAPALVAVAALALTACSGGGDDGAGDTAGGGDGAGGASTGIVTANSSEPQNPLIPTNTNEVGGGRVLDLVFSGLVYYAADGSAHNEVAESIESEDNQTFTVTLEEGGCRVADSVFALHPVPCWVGLCSVARM